MRGQVTEELIARDHGKHLARKVFSIPAFRLNNIYLARTKVYSSRFSVGGLDDHFTSLLISVSSYRSASPRRRDYSQSCQYEDSCQSLLTMNKGLVAVGACQRVNCQM